MTDPEDLVRRFLILWAEYLAALFADTAPTGPPGESAKAAAAAPAPAEDGAGTPSGEPGPPAGTAPAAGAPDERHDAVVELARRIADLEERVRGLERGAGAAAPSRRRNRGTRA
jgi:hypothetical protein